MKAFGWKSSCPIPPDSRRALEDSRLCWDELEAPEHRAVLAFYQSLVALRRRFSELARPGKVSFDEASSTLRMTRAKTCVFANLGEKPRRFRSEPGSRILLASRAGVQRTDHHIELPPGSACLLERRHPGQEPRGGTNRRRRS
jgi:maltooligosyltrehalose trehalohydrolase